MGGHWYWLTRVVPEKWPLNVCVLRIKSISTSLLCQLAASSYQDCKRLLHRRAFAYRPAVWNSLAATQPGHPSVSSHNEHGHSATALEETT